MDSGMIGKIEKARKYAQERERFNVESLKVTFDGDNNPHTITLENGTWNCDCDFFQTRGRCSHTMAIERIMEGMSGLYEPTS